MEKLAYILLPSILVVLALRTKKDVKEYERFKKLDNTKTRQSTYKKWVIESTLIFGLGSLIILALVGHFDAIVQPLTSFTEFKNKVNPISESIDESGFSVGLFTGIVIFLVITISRFKANQRNKETSFLPDFQAMIPRNNRERIWALLIAINAGITEELFFRIMLPIMFYIVLPNALVALLCACIVFGLMHWYQGPVGIIVTFVMGVVFTAVYLSTKQIWIVMLIHAIIDINGLLIMPSIQHFLKTMFSNEEKG